ncbi:MAG: DUF5011 domain-containing protein [Mollicutes bacterium]|nr:DUF5011 domain-containing protein [Mollicutes bacterium]
MKKAIKKIKKTIKSNKTNILIMAISLIAFIVGGIAINFLVSLLIVGGINALLFIPDLLKKKSNKKKSSKKKQPKKKQSNKKRKPKKKRKKLIKIILIFFISIGILAILAVALFFWLIIKRAPEFDPEKLYYKESSIVYDSNGEIIAKLGVEKREKVTFEELPEVLVDAIIATEDARFLQHNGFDLPRFMKASIGQLLGKSGAGGASTITMQLVKQHFTSTVATGIEGIIRKFTDIYMSIFKIEKKYTKKEIFEFYVNSNYLGGGAYGVEQACLTYFGKSAKDVNLAEAAIIAGLFQAPHSYDPFINPELTEQRMKQVLYLMDLHEYITKEERDIVSKIKVQDLLVKNNTNNVNKYQSFIDTVAAEVDELTGHDPYSVPMKIYTTMDREKQNHIYDIMSGTNYKWENDFVNAGIAVVDVKTGAIAAVGAGRNTVQRGFNNATMIKRQIGSTAKPLYDYGPGIEYNNWSTYQPFVDEKHAYSNGINIHNWDHGYNGFMTLRSALVYSRNIPAIKAFQQLSNKNIQNFVANLGLSPELEGNLIHEAHAIGGYNGESPLSLAAAYAAFANGGYYNEPYSFTKIVYRDTGEVYERKPKKVKAMSVETAYMITDVLIDTSKYALGRYSNINNRLYAAKTGTTNFPSEVFKQYKLPSGAINDLWVTGYNTEYAIAVWYGYEVINKNHVTIFGSQEHSRLFQAVGKGIFTSNEKFTKPKNVVEVKIEKDTYPAMLPSEFTPSDMIVTELFKKGTETTEVSKRYSRLDNVTNLNSTINGNTVTLTWDPIPIPDAINRTKLEQFFKSLYKQPADQQKYLNARLNYNNKNIGNLGYNVYLKDSNGNLQLLEFTTNNHFTHTVTPGITSITYVVKSSYSIFKSNQSTGVEHTIVLDNNPAIITSMLNGQSTIVLSVGQPFIDPYVIVYNSGIDVTSQATITKKVFKIVDGQETEVTSDIIDTSTPGTYKIEYKISYQSYNETHTRTVNIQ